MGQEFHQILESRAKAQIRKAKPSDFADVVITLRGMDVHRVAHIGEPKK
jgi:hypothetical protein